MMDANVNTEEHREAVRRNNAAAFVRRMQHLIRSGEYAERSVR